MEPNAIACAFAYDLPPQRIAQRPVKPYDQAKLLVANRQAGSLGDSVFNLLPELLHPGDLLVLNDTRVVRARLLGRLADGDAACELLCLEEAAPLEFRCLGKPLKKLRPGRRILFDAGLEAVVLQRVGEFEVTVRFSSASGNVRAALDSAGTMPIPPYIRKGCGDQDDVADYQTCFAAHSGSVAAPTASLHFTPELLQRIEGKGVRRVFVTLHVGPASFLPLADADGAVRRTPGPEWYVHSNAVLEAIVQTRAAGGRVFAVGTTVVRALESMHRVEAADGERRSTELFITPGFDFRAIDGLITNFHQPRTTHLLLVEAFIGRTRLEEAYAHALAGGYRFLSYGDGMIVL